MLELSHNAAVDSMDLKMRILFIGGTRFVGLAMAQHALARGHVVDIFHRGNTVPLGLEGATHIQGDRGGSLCALSQGEWDAVVDLCAYRPHEVQALVTALGSRVGHYVLISSLSVYADDVPPRFTEEAALADTGGLAGQDLKTMALGASSYGPLKVLCERALAQRPGKQLIIRPCYVIGPQDYTQRFPEWVRRIAAGGIVPAPGPREAPMNYIDARDLASFVVRCIEREATGALNTTAPQGSYSFENFLEATLAAVGPAGTQLDWLTPEQAKASGLSFPLWAGGTMENKRTADSSAAVALGLSCRSLQQSASDVLQWDRATSR